MTKMLYLTALMLVCATTHGQTNITALLEKIKRLDDRISTLESSVAPAVSRGSTVGMGLDNVDARQPDLAPWSIVGYDATNNVLTLTNGFVEIHNDGGTTYLAPSDMTVTLANGPNYVYLEVNPVNSNCTLNVRYTAKPVSTTTLYRKVLWAITYSTSTTPPMITDAFQYQNNNVEYTGWRPPW